MKEIVHNDDLLTEEDVTDVSIRVKVLLLKDDYIYIGNADQVYQFPGGHLEEGESFDTCLKREILEETGIEIQSDDIGKPFMKVTFLNRDYPLPGVNRKSEIYYYAIRTDAEPDLMKTHYT